MGDKTRKQSKSKVRVEVEDAPDEAPTTPEVQLARIQLEGTKVIADAKKRDGLVSIILASIRNGTYLGLAVLALLAVRSVAGTETTFNAVIKLAVDLGLDRWVLVTITALVGIAWRRERVLRRKTIKELGEYARELETRIDPARTSSQLTATGERRKEDRDAD